MINRDFSLKTPSAKILPSEITSESNYLNRRRFLRDSGMVIAGAALTTGFSPDTSAAVRDLSTVKSRYSIDEVPNSWEDITTYNNFYEFGLDKDDPYQNAQEFKTDPWSVKVSGECDKPGNYTLEDIMRPHTLEDRIYRHRVLRPGPWSSPGWVFHWVIFSQDLNRTPTPGL